MPSSFENVCIFHILDGLRDGLSHFSGTSRVALIYAPTPTTPPHIWDPQHLLRGHEPKLQDVYLYASAWRGTVPEGTEIEFFDDEHCDSLGLAGIINYGGRSSAMAYQMWFTEEHPDMCCTGPTKRWLEYATRLFSQNYALQDVMNIDTAGYVLQQCATHAVRDYLVDERSAMGRLDTKLRIYPVLDTVLGVSRTPEEGRMPRGTMVFCEPRDMDDINFMALFPDQERPQASNHKHVRKLLQCVEDSGFSLVSDGQYLVGVAVGAIPDTSVVAEFRGPHGFLSLNGLQVASFSEGGFHSSNRQANLVQLEELLLETDLDNITSHYLFRIVKALVNSAREHGHGSGIVLDLGPESLDMAGQNLVHPLPLRVDRFLEMAKDLSKVDGALHITRDGKLCAFGCLLDGVAVPGENRSRGARFNSAVRFSALHEDVVVIVVSSDRPVSIIRGGIELTAACQWMAITGCPSPPTLQEWIRL